MQTTTGTSPSPPAEADPDRPYQKRIRLSLACNQCRKRKVRCDTSLPKCRNCVQRNEHCETSDLRRPDHGPGVRVLAVKPTPASAPVPAPAHHDVPPGSDQPVQGPVQGDSSQHKSRPAGPPRSLSHSSTRSLSKPQQVPVPGHVPASSPRSQGEQSHATASTPDSQNGRHGSEPAGSASGSTSSRPEFTWVQRAYQISTSAGHHNDGKSMTPTTPDVVVNTDDTAYRVKFAGGSSLQCLCTFVDLHLCSRGLRPVSPGFKQGMMYSEEFELPLMPHLPTLPVRPETDGYVAAFMRRVWPLYPVVDEVTVSTDIDYIMQVQAMHGDAFARHLPQLTLPTLAVTYAILALGSAELAGQATPLSTSYLTAAYSLYGHLIALPYTVSVQALFLITLALRAQMRDGQAWQVLGQALRIAYSIGIHRTSPQRDAASKVMPAPRRPPPACSPGYQSDAGLHSRLWWSCYALERLVQLESGRPSVVHDRVGDGVSNIDSDQGGSGAGDSHQTPTLPPLLDASTHASEYFVAWVSLAHIMGKISDQFYGQKPRTSAELFTRVYRLDQMLNKWKETLPNSVRLRKDAASRASRHAVASNGASMSQFANHSRSNGTDSSDDDDDNDNDDQYNERNAANGGHSEQFEYQHHLASFLSLQQYMAHITLLRIALIFPHGDFLAEVQRQRDKLPPGGHAQARLINGSDVCLGAARSIITEATTLADEGERSVLLGANPMLVSAMVLALGILRQPTRRLARADLQLFHLGLELVEEYLSRWVVVTTAPSDAAVVTSGGGGSGADMTGLVCLLRDQVDAYHAQFRRRGAAGATTAAPSSMGKNNGGQNGSLHQRNDSGHARMQQQHQDGPLSHDRQQEHPVGPQGGFSISELVGTESATRAMSRTSATNSGDMPPPPPPQQQPNPFGTSGHYADGNSSNNDSMYASAAGDHGVPSSGSLSAMLMDSSGTYDLTPFLDSSLINHHGGDGTTGNHGGGGGGGEGVGGYSGGGGMETFEGLAFDELWNMIGTDVRADYPY